MSPLWRVSDQRKDALLDIKKTRFLFIKCKNFRGDKLSDKSLSEYFFVRELALSKDLSCQKFFALTAHAQWKNRD